jgi:DNA-binding transcriptional MocR family regulator
VTTTTPARTSAVRHLSAPATARLLGAWRAGGPAYVALADALRAAVLAGSLPALTRLPSERDLAAVLKVSRTTTSAAYARLRELGFAASHVGSGTVAVLPRGGRPAAGRPAAGDAPVPDLADEHAVDLAQATPGAVDALHDAYARELEALPAYLATGGYAHLGLDPLREAVARRYTARGVPTDADQVLVTTGAQQALAVLASTLVRRGTTAVVESPTYFHGIEVLHRAGARVVGVPPGDVEALESAVRTTGARYVYLVPDHHNPTGTSLDPERRRAVADLAARLDVTVVGDETLTDLGLDDDAALPPLAGPGTDPRLVSVGSASKSFWGGLRVGWVRADRQLVHRLGAARQVLDIATPVLEQLAVAELLDREDQILPGRRAAVRAQRDLLVEQVRDTFPTWDVPRPAGGLCLWVDLGRPVAQQLAAAGVAEGVQVSPGPRFTPDGSATDHVRLTYTRSPAALTDGVERLARAWRRVTG